MHGVGLECGGRPEADVEAKRKTDGNAMRWPWQSKSVEPNSRDFLGVICCPKCGTINESEWLDALADIWKCRACGYGNTGKVMRRKSPPGSLAVYGEQDA